MDRAAAAATDRFFQQLSVANQTAHLHPPYNSGFHIPAVQLNDGTSVISQHDSSAFQPTSVETDFEVDQSGADAQPEVATSLLWGFAAGIMVTIILGTVFGNVLVIVSVLRINRLRVVANSFIVSLAIADLLVALLVMTFSASQHIAGRWLFGDVICDIFNANDVLFSTASLLHLCCISVDRYWAVTDPFKYGRKMSPRRAAAMLTAAWTASALLSHAPIHLGWYAVSMADDEINDNRISVVTSIESLLTTVSDDVLMPTVEGPLLTTSDDLPSATVDGKSYDADDVIGPKICSFEVNAVYGVVSSCVSFWTPAAVIVFAYVKIFREAQRQQARIRSLTSSMSSSHGPCRFKHHPQQEQQQQQQYERPVRDSVRLSPTPTASTSQALAAIGSATAALIMTSSSPIDVTIPSRDANISQNCLNGVDVRHPCPTSMTSSPASHQIHHNDNSNNGDTVAAGSDVRSRCSLHRCRSWFSSSSQTASNRKSVKRHQSSASVWSRYSRTSQGSGSSSSICRPTQLQQQQQLAQQQRRQLQRDHKAARTLGVVVGAFLVCWLPFFAWYLTVTLCGSQCPETPGVVVGTLFWVGYANSALNPIIYAAFNRDFRDAFRRQLCFWRKNGGIRRRGSDVEMSTRYNTSGSSRKIFRYSSVSGLRDNDKSKPIVEAVESPGSLTPFGQLWITMTSPICAVYRSCRHLRSDSPVAISGLCSTTVGRGDGVMTSCFIPDVTETRYQSIPTNA